MYFNNFDPAGTLLIKVAQQWTTGSTECQPNDGTHDNHAADPTLQQATDDLKGARGIGIFTFRRRTGIDLPGEIASEFPTGTEYYDRLYGARRWTSAVTLNLAIGQGENAQTLMSMVRLYQMLATDGTSRLPYVVRPRERGGVSLGLSEDHLGVLRRALLNVVERGTARGSRLAEITIAGKTSTAQNPQGPDHGWFIGFAPAEKPEIVGGAIIEFWRHGSSLAPLVARTIAKYLGADSTLAREIRIVLPRDSAPEPIQVLPGPPIIIPIIPDSIRVPTPPGH